ncbi:MAG: hypothetical protein AAGE18_00295 [Pseudomonadota bacterium]
MGRPVYFFLHVPKCAGTTVEQHFAAALGDGFLIAPRWESVRRNFIGNRYDFAPGALDRVAVVSGHSLSTSLRRHLPGREVREVLLIREPLSWFLSFYNYRLWRQREWGEPAPPRFATWYRGQRTNPISRFILNRYFEVGYPEILTLSSQTRLRRLNRDLARFHFVGDLRFAGEVIAAASAELGLPAEVTPRNVGAGPTLRAEDLPQDLRARIARENAVDAALHRLWSERRFAEGAPDGTAEAEAALPAGDQLSYTLRDAVGTAIKKLSRHPALHTASDER